MHTFYEQVWLRWILFIAKSNGAIFICGELSQGASKNNAKRPHLHLLSGKRASCGSWRPKSSKFISVIFGYFWLFWFNRKTWPKPVGSCRKSSFFMQSIGLSLVGLQSAESVDTSRTKWSSHAMPSSSINLYYHYIILSAYFMLKSLWEVVVLLPNHN